MGEVYRARDTRLGRDVAVKVLPERLASDPVALARFTREARAVAQLSHPSIRALHDIGLNVTFDKVEKLPELRKQAQLGRVQSFSYGWIADYPDGENFLQLFWTKSIGGANYAMFSHPEFDRLYEESRKLPDSPQRTKLYDRMTDLVVAYAPWRLTHHLLEDHVIQPWVIGYKPHPIRSDIWKYLDIDESKRQR